VDTFGAEVAHDAIVYHNATVGPEALVGEGSVVFMGAVVGHEAQVGTGCVLAANSVLNARVALGEGVYVGTNSTVLPEISVGAWATIGAGSVVLEDVPEGATVMGVPAEILFTAATKEKGVSGEVASVEIDHELERTICNIWQEVLQLPNVEVSHNFFDMGGNSLLAVRLPERVRRATGRKISVTDVFRFPTIRSLATHMVEEGGGQREARTRPSRADLRREIHANWRTRH
jgi:carbonic anhydrase/acetyltransferase-like protein (isoleucine patch superfamily)